MANRPRDVCGLPKSKTLWRAGRGFGVRDLPWTVEKLRVIPPFEFENWAVIALGGIPNKVQVGDMGVDGRINPVRSAAAPRCVQLARVLQKTASFYYHCDWHASHYVKVMLDQIFGEN